EVFEALERGAVETAVVPVENSHAGSVLDVYDLLRRHRGMRIVAEAMVRVRYLLLGVQGARLEGVRSARSHPQSLAQVDLFLRGRSTAPVVAFDSAGAAAEVAQMRDPSVAAVASSRAAARYGLVVLARSIETSPDNTTRFFALARDGDEAAAARIPPSFRAG